MKSKDVKDMIVDAVVDLVFTVLACFFAAVFSTMIVSFINKIVQLSFISNAGVRAALLSMFAAAFLIFFSYKYGYQFTCFDGICTVLSALLASVAHFFISLLTLFSPWIAGATKPIGGFIKYGTNYMSDTQTQNIPLITLVTAGVVVSLIHVGLVVLGTHLGTQRRLADRAALTEEKTKK